MLKDLSLIHFRNYIQKQFEFTSSIVGIVGPNGTGKTNLLDAIYYLSFTKSYFNRPDGQNIHHENTGMRISGNYKLAEQLVPITCVIRENLKKEFYFDEVLYTKFSKHIGKIPCVMIAPDDIQIITGLSEERRKLMDSLLAQIHPDYLQYLIQYQKILVQRNSLLKMASEQGSLDEVLMATLNKQLIAVGNPIYAIRKEKMQALIEQIGIIYKQIAGKEDAIVISYQSSLSHQSFEDLLKTNFEKDCFLQRTHAGIHKDDLLITIQGQPFKQQASQGQRKSLLFAIRFAEWQTIKKEKGISPILLLDDIFEKLDEKRMAKLLEWVSKSTEGQVFITDTHKDRMDQLLGKYLLNYQLIQL